MRPVVTPEEMKRADQATISAGTPGAVLMERAGRAVARAVIRVAGGRYDKRVAVVCGPGNNGGDGFVAARVLRNEGLGIRCLFVGDLDSVAGDARVHKDRLVTSGVSIEPFDPSALAGADVVIDALFGTGFRGAVEGDAAAAIEAIDALGAPVVAIDIPSGVDGSNGRVDGIAVKADVTLAIGAEKVGTAIGKGALHAGQIEVVDIGIHVSDPKVFMLEEVDVMTVLPARSPDSHKRSVGSVGLLCGAEGMSGAAILAARGAVRMGAGYVTLGVPATIEPIVSGVLPEVLTSTLTEEAYLGPPALDAFKAVLDRADAVGIGPGIGQGEPQRKLVHAALEDLRQPLVLDADALNVLAGHTGPLIERNAPTVLTPHPAELARLLERPTASVQSDRLAVARGAAQTFRCTVVLKGYRSIIAAPDSTAVINPTGSAGLATAGTGDVLTGALAALLAAGLDGFEAAWAATYVHGVAGEIVGNRGVVAWDVAEVLPEAMTSMATLHP